MDKLTVGKFIAGQRKQLSLTQKQFAEQLGVTDKAVSRWETGKGYPDIETVEAISIIFGVTVNDVLSGKIIVPEEKEKTADRIIIDTMKENRRVKKKWLCTLVFAAMLGVLLIGVLIPLLYFTLLPDLRDGNYIVYSDKYYKLADENSYPDSFVFYAQESGYEGKIIGRDGIDIIRKKNYENVIYNSEILGRNAVYALFDAEDIPAAEDALNYTVSLRYVGEDGYRNTETGFSKDAAAVTAYLNGARASRAVDYFSLNTDDYEHYRICMDCFEFAGYYIIGDIMIGETSAYFRPIDNADVCYEISVEELM